MSAPTCGLCPAFLLFPESVALRLCHGCRSPAPEQRVNTALEFGCFGRLLSASERRELVEALRAALADFPQRRTNTEGV